MLLNSTSSKFFIHCLYPLQNHKEITEMLLYQQQQQVLPALIVNSKNKTCSTGLFSHEKHIA
jgi:hypothetical protein